MRGDLRDLGAGGLYLLVGLLAVGLGREYPMGTATRMGPGYFPTVLGGLLAVIGLAVAIRALRRPARPLPAMRLPALALVLGATVLFGLLVRGAGLVAAVLALVLVSAPASRNAGWPGTVALALGLAVFCAAVFTYGLRLPLPLAGPWLGG